MISILIQMMSGDLMSFSTQHHFPRAFLSLVCSIVNTQYDLYVQRSAHCRYSVAFVWIAMPHTDAHY